MIFKNLMLYTLMQPAEIYLPLLREKLVTRGFVPCTPGQAKSVGFIPPADGEFWHEQSGALMLAVQIQEKKIPASALRDLVDEKVKEIEAEQERKVYRKERLTIKNDIFAAKLPGTVPTNTRIYAYIDTQLNMVIVDAGSSGNAEIVLNLIREAVGSLPALFPEVNNSPAHCMTNWIRGGAAPDGFVPGYDCELSDPSTDSKVRCTGVDLKSEEVESHIDTGKQVTMLRIDWDETLSAVIKDQYRIKSVRFADKLFAEDESEDDISKFDADMAIMVGTVRQFVPALGAAFGGWLNQQYMKL